MIIIYYLQIILKKAKKKNRGSTVNVDIKKDFTNKKV
jgi:hypothetical protein